MFLGWAHHDNNYYGISNVIKMHKKPGAHGCLAFYMVLDNGTNSGKRKFTSRILLTC